MYASNLLCINQFFCTHSHAENSVFGLSLTSHKSLQLLSLSHHFHDWLAFTDSTTEATRLLFPFTANTGEHATDTGGCGIFYIMPLSSYPLTRALLNPICCCLSFIARHFYFFDGFCRVQLVWFIH